MLYWLSQFSEAFGPLNVLRYITFRTGGAMMTALVFVFLFGPWIISHLRVRQGKGQPIRDDLPHSQLITKKSTPTMGGLMILLGILVATLLWGNLTNRFVWIVLGVTLSFGAVGLYDDYLKVSRQSSAGFSGRARFAIETALAVLACIAILGPEEVWEALLAGRSPVGSVLTFPFFKDFVQPLSWFYLLFGAVVIVGAGNAVNLTDGLDGLATVPVIIAALSFGFISYLAGNSVFADYLNIHYVAGTGELAVLCGAVIGAGLGFLWFNAPPAQIFMGDTGSLALGGLLGSIAVASRHEIVLAIIGGLFVIEALSVILQVLYFRRTKKRIFLMAPLHHHFERKGWTEPQIVIRFWIIAVVLALVGLSTLKLR
jgi:phospho-N-acetylmuramoyl-pentapeptide-transferase